MKAAVYRKYGGPDVRELTSAAHARSRRGGSAAVQLANFTTDGEKYDLLVDTAGAASERAKVVADPAQLQRSEGFRSLMNESLHSSGRSHLNEKARE